MWEASVDEKKDGIGNTSIRLSNWRASVCKTICTHLTNHIFTPRAHFFCKMHPSICAWHIFLIQFVHSHHAPLEWLQLLERLRPSAYTSQHLDQNFDKKFRQRWIRDDIGDWTRELGWKLVCNHWSAFRNYYLVIIGAGPHTLFSLSLSLFSSLSFFFSLSLSLLSFNQIRYLGYTRPLISHSISLGNIILYN